jgi:hypothetical protein
MNEDYFEFQEEKRRLKAEYGELYFKVSEILFRHDPEGINFETNTDEYEPEVETILPRLREASSATELRRIIREEFIRWFGADEVGTEIEFEEIAQEVWSAYRRR